MLAGGVGAALNGALSVKHFSPLKEQLFPFAAALTALGIEITSPWIVWSFLKYGGAWAAGNRCAAPA